MALQTITPLPYPEILSIAHAQGGNAYSAALAMDAAGEKVAFIFTIPKSGTLDTVEIQFGTVTTAKDLKVSFQDVSLVNGDPDGNIDQFRVIPLASISSGGVAETGLITSDGTDTGTKRSVTQGDKIAIVIAFDSLTGNLIVRGAVKDTRAWISGLVYADLFETAWVKTVIVAPNFTLKYSDGSFAYIPGVIPSSNLSQTTINNTAADELGIKFQVPFKCKISGAIASIDLDGDADIILYDASDNILESVSLDKDVRPDANPGYFAAIFDTEVELSINTVYRLVVKPTSVTNVIVRDIRVSSAARMDSVPGGQNFHRTFRQNAGAWTDTTTERPYISLLITALDDGANVTSGGSGAVAAMRLGM